ncbi:hypothetical protein BKA64DRAFT_715732 [Cadophora sp. MPI-SDFR-AT-0126]|nr:hypothetical protein BKA64DRAFT_715732 [Leotiomycetes sp. MPI-SDFR-AT-0126]
MSTPGDIRDRGVLQKLRALAKGLQDLQGRRLQQDHQFATMIASEYQEILENHSNRRSEMRIEHSIRRGEESVKLWKQDSNPRIQNQNKARAKRDQALVHLKEVEEKEKAELEADLQRLTGEAEVRKYEYIQSLEHEREIEDKKTAELILKLSGGMRYPENLLGQIIMVDKMIAAHFSLSNAGPSPSSDPVLAENGHGKGIGFDSPTLKMYGMSPGNSIPQFGLLTPDNTPPSSNEPRFASQQPPETPTHAPRRKIQPSVLGARLELLATTTFGAPLTTNTSASKLPPLFKFRTGAPVSTSAKKVEEKNVIDLTSDSDDALPTPKGRQVGTGSAVQTDNLPSMPELTPPSSVKPAVKTPKKKAKKPIVNPVISSPPEAFTNNDIQTSTEVFGLVVQEVPKKLKKISKPIPAPEIRETTPGIFDSDSDYEDPQTRKRRRGPSSSSHEPPRNRSGKLLNGEIFDAPGSELSVTKGGVTWKNWARRVYLPKKLLCFTVNFIWTHKENGEISTWNDSTSAVGFHFFRKARSFVPVIERVRREGTYPEFVLEEDEIVYVQYNSEHALVCVTRNTGVQSDVVIKFGSREDLWNFLAVGSMEMDIRVEEK